MALMDNQHHGISPYTVNLPRRILKQMIRVVRTLQTLSETPDYPAYLPELSINARINTKHFSVLMGYDFHITENQQAKLIEVNTNAGGLWYACRCYEPDVQQFPNKLAAKLLQTFINEYQLFAASKTTKPQLIAIVDQAPKAQFLYPEMQAFAQLFQQTGIKTIIVDPDEIDSQLDGVYFQNERIDLIYNRHCDFYLRSPEMQGIAQAWRNQSVCLTPNPRIYGLLADKQRMADWSQTSLLSDLLPSNQAEQLQQALPVTQLLNSYAPETLWSERKQWVFKPLNSYASRGVYIGDKLTRNKFNSFDPQTTLVQQRIKPNITMTADKQQFKTDFRLFVYRNTILAVSARIYQGQVTNLRTPHGGFCKIKLT